MPEITKHMPGTFSWFDAGFPDVDGAKRFYGEVLGWSFVDSPMGGGEMYTMCQVKGLDVAAMFPQRPEMRAAGVPPHWQSYITVENVDELAARVEGLGGKVMMPPFDVMEEGRMALVQDPTGAVVALWQAKNHIGAKLVGDAGSFCWSELMTTDTDEAAAFYRGLLGWDAKDSGMPGMKYMLFKVQGQENAVAGMMAMSPEMGPMPSSWLTYFTVENADAALERVERLGGKALMPIASAPGVGRFVTVMDPQGVVFALIQPEPPQ